jgi:CubicO group peptidase (beta-lactamase class C family)
MSPRNICTISLALWCIGSPVGLRADHIDEVVGAQMQGRHITGLALAIIQDSAIIREQGYGFADKSHRTPVTRATLFQAGSVSKPVAAVGALHLVEQGRLSLDEDVDSRLRAWLIPQNKFTRQHPVTLRLLLSHSAGVTGPSFPGYTVDAPVPSLVQILDGEKPANTPAIRVNQVPGSKWRYSGGGYLVMQQMMIDVTGKPFAQYMDETVLKPLGMASSTYAQPLPDAMASRAATGYVGSSENPVKGRWRVKPELAAGGLWTTAGDLARFAIGIQRSLAGISNPVISKSMTRLMLTKQRNDSGLGVFLSGTPLRFGHNGSNVGYDTVMVAYADTGQGAVIMMNANANIEVLKNILVDAIAEQYHWPGLRAPRTRTLASLANGSGIFLSKHSRNYFCDAFSARPFP